MDSTNKLRARWAGLWKTSLGTVTFGQDERLPTPAQGWRWKHAFPMAAEWRMRRIGRPDFNWINFKLDKMGKSALEPNDRYYKIAKGCAPSTVSKTHSPRSEENRRIEGIAVSKASLSIGKSQCEGNSKRRKREKESGL
ncbi:uncharacterized protein LOC143208196 isoform X1 [Lasioglossum baleicum]|uniref:uncharacterized protein LOC143208196 isoform X1 n=1 Tax=Lasioglossum baleicum TaxID=434251 RepID=UPI003FCE3B26